MFREIRRKNRRMSEESRNTLLKTTNYGILSTVDKDNVPYGVPLSFIYTGEVIYLHGALVGHKIDNIRYNNQICFTVVDNNSVKLLPSEFSTKYKSVVVFGTISMVEDIEEKQEALEAFLVKYSSDYYDVGLRYIDSLFKATNVFKIEIVKMTGKAK